MSPLENLTISVPANGQSDVPVVCGRTAADPRRARACVCGAGLVAVLLGTGVLAAGCGGRPSGQAVASLETTTTTTRPSPPLGGSDAGASPAATAGAFSECMRTHGLPGFPTPDIHGRSVRIVITPGSGVDPNSPQFAAATNACKHLLPGHGVPSNGPTITPADQADYIKAAACVRSHGVPDFPDPTFRNNSVSFNSSSPIDTNSSLYKTAVTTCQKLIPAGLPYSSGSTGP
jgi:hypothetical protein